MLGDRVEYMIQLTLQIFKASIHHFFLKVSQKNL